MALPKQVGDSIVFEERAVTAAARPLSPATEKEERVVDILLRAHPSNVGTIFIGDSGNQPWPLAANESVAIAVSKRNILYYRGTAPTTDKLLVVVIMGSPNINSLGAVPGTQRQFPKVPDFEETC